jgi:Holliday junction resolvase RusA-like endonuclease
MIRNIVIPLDPFAKGRPRFGKGFTYTPAKTRKQERDLIAQIRLRWQDEPWTGALAVAVRFTVKRPKSVKVKKRPWPAVKPDVDNMVKSLFDCSNGIIWDDDAQVVSLNAEKTYGKDGEIWLCVARYEG